VAVSLLVEETEVSGVLVNLNNDVATLSLVNIINTELFCVISIPSVKLVLNLKVYRKQTMIGNHYNCYPDMKKPQNKKNLSFKISNKSNPCNLR
jgi:hypothetical protein